MWKERLKEIIEEKKLYAEKVNKGAAEEEVQIFEKKVCDELNVTLPEEYLRVLKVINGIEFNGFILYGIDEPVLKETPNQRINGFIEYNKIWYENEWQQEFIFLGESNISWYVYDINSKMYYELDNPSGRKCEEFGEFDALLVRILSDSLQ